VAPAPLHDQAANKILFRNQIRTAVVLTVLEINISTLIFYKQLNFRKLGQKVAYFFGKNREKVAYEIAHFFFGKNRAA
jgi:ribosomal protein S18 acetylase RimI-like enzyme